MSCQEGRCLASYITSYTALSSISARSRMAWSRGSDPCYSAYPSQNAAEFLATHSSAVPDSRAASG
jgi:hypothetical protein